MGRAPSKFHSLTMLLGKPIKSGSVLSEVLDRVQHVVPTVTLHLSTSSAPAPLWVDESHLIVQRGLDLESLRAALPLERSGIHCCNSIQATIGLLDRRATGSRLMAAGIFTPRSLTFKTWSDLVESSQARPIVVKVNTGGVGRGAAVYIARDGLLAENAPFDGPYICEDFVENDGQDRKLYVAGANVRGLLKRGQPQSRGGLSSGEPFDVSEELADLARSVGEVLDLDIFGVDVLVGPDGLYVVDVNPFPAFRGVPGAAKLIGSYLISLFQGG